MFGHSWGDDGADKIRDNLAISILVTIFCCIPFGVPAIVYSVSAMTKYEAGKYAAADDYSQKARRMSIIGAICGAAIIIGVLILYRPNK